MKVVSLVIAAAVALAGCGDSASPVSRDTGDATISADRGGGGPAKVSLCHVTDNGDSKTITVSGKAVDAHLAHGDAMGPCEDVCVPEPYVDPDGCSPDLLLRTPDVVVTDLRAALAAGDWTAFACNYHPDAFVIDDQGLLLGRTEIVAAAQSLVDLFDGALPVITQEDIFRGVVRTLFTLDGGWIVIPDGTHTYVIENGLVTRQTTHGIIEFTGPPPDGF